MVLVVVGTMVFVPSSADGFPSGAAAAEAVAAREVSEAEGPKESRRALWRGRHPLICPAARQCPDAKPTFCLVDAADQVLPRAAGREPCPRGLEVRDAGRSARKHRRFGTKNRTRKTPCHQGVSFERATRFELATLTLASRP